MDFTIDKSQVYDLSDMDLVKAAHLIQLKSEGLHLNLTPWEKQFCSGVVEHYREDAKITWKQRKSLRELLIKISETLIHRARVDTELKAAEESLR